MNNLAEQKEYEEIRENLMRKIRENAEISGDMELEAGIHFWKDDFVIKPCAGGFAR